MEPDQDFINPCRLTFFNSAAAAATAAAFLRSFIVKMKKCYLNSI